MADRSVKVRLEAVIGPYQRAMAEATAATRKLSQEEKDLKKATEDIGRGMQRAGTMMTIGLTAPLLLLAKHAADVAMTAQETANRVTVAFREQEDAVHRWSEGSSHSMGLARHEAEGTASTFATMFQQMGLGTDDVFKMSTGIVQLAADVGSFHDVDPSLMLEKMRAGVVGEYEPLRQLGIVLTDVQVRQEAVRMGLAESTSEVSTAGLVQARYSLILKQTSLAQGDYARTAHSATNATRTAHAAFEDAMAELGGHLLPLVTKGAEVVTALAEGFQALSPAGQTAILVFGGLAAVAGPAIFITGALIRNLDLIALKAPLAATGLRTVTMAAGGIGLALTAAAIAYQIFADHEDDATASVVNMAEAFETFGRGETAAAKRIVLETLASEGLLQQLNSLGITTAAVTDIMTTHQDGTVKNVAAMNAWDAALNGAVASGQITREEADKLSRSVFRVSNSYSDAAGNAADIVDANEDVSGSADDAALSIEDFTKALDKLYGKTFGVQEATDRLTGDLADFADEVMAAKIAGDANAASLSEGTLQGLRNREMLRGLSKDALDVAAAMREQGAAPEEIAAAMDSYRGSILSVVGDLGMSATEASTFVDLLLHIDGIVATPSVTLETADAKKQLDDLLLRLWAMQTGGDALGSIIADIVGGAAHAAPAPVAASVQSAIAGQGPKATGARDSHKGDADAYLRALHDQEEEAKRTTEAINGYLRAMYEHGMELEDNQFRAGDMATDRYLEILRKRLVGLEQYSSEWMRVYDQIKQLEGDTLDSELKIIEAVEKQRQFDIAFYGAASQRYMTPVSSGGSTTIYNTKNWSPSYTANGSDAASALATNMQKDRDYAALAGV